MFVRVSMRAKNNAVIGGSPPRQSSRFTSATASDGSGYLRADRWIKPITWACQMPAVNPLPAMSPRANPRAEPNSITLKKSPERWRTGKISPAISYSPQVSSRGAQSLRCTWAASKMACCSRACSRRRASTSSVSDWRLSVRSHCTAGELRSANTSAEAAAAVSANWLAIAACLISSILSVQAIMLLSPHEFVADSVHGQKITRLVGNGFEFLANADNMRVDGAGGRKILVTPHFVEKAVAAQGLSGMTEKVLEELELLSGKLDALAGANNLITAEIDLHIAKGITVLIFRKCVRSPQNRLDASKELADREGLGDIVIGPELETDDLIHFLAASCKHDDGNRRAFGLELLANVQTAHTRHHHVEHNQIRRILEGPLEPFNAIERGDHLEAFVFEIVAKTGDHVWFILNNQNL